LRAASDRPSPRADGANLRAAALLNALKVSCLVFNAAS